MHLHKYIKMFQRSYKIGIPPGVALIVNNLNFPTRRINPQREGSEIDVEKLILLMDLLQYEIFETSKARNCRERIVYDTSPQVRV
jgi:hypothetical protein